MARALVEGYRFSVAGDRENLLDAVVHVGEYKLLHAGSGLPIKGGCYDARMGAFNHMFQCGTCGLPKKACPGHFGVIRTPFPVESPVFISEIRKWLRVACLTCGALVVDPAAFSEEPRGRRLMVAANAAKEDRPCPRCEALHPKIVKSAEDYFTFYAEGLPGPTGARPSRELYPTEILAAFERIAPADAAALGRPYHPRSLFLKAVPVPPNTIRPSTRMGLGPGGAASNHDTTNMVQHFLRNTQLLPGTVPDVIDPKTATVWSNSRQLYHDEIVGSASAKATNGSTGRRSIVAGSRAVNSIMRGLARKKGRFRKNLTGKRVWGIMRSTISGNPHIAADEVGIPIAFARTVQVEETIQEFNRDRLLKYFINGTTQYPGCSRVWRRATGKWHRVSGPMRGFHLEVGDRIERDIVDGDLGYFGRAPSLERSSTGVHRVVVLRDPTISTFQMNVVATPWYNADFDGDQMNLWVPRTAMGQAEAFYLSSVRNWFISTKSSGPVIGQIQDSIVGSFELTRQAAVVDKFHAMSFFAQTRAPPPNFAEGDAATRYTGRELFSELLRQTPISYEGTPKWYNPSVAPFIKYLPSEIHTSIVRGKFVSGVLDTTSIGASAAGGVFHRIAREYGAQRALESVYDLQQLSIAYLGCRGFTVGAADMVLTADAVVRLGEITEGILLEAETVTRKLVRGELIPPIGMTTRQYYEHEQRQALQVQPDKVLEPILGSVNLDWNGLARMVMLGSKGKIPNLIHIMAIIGSIEINGQRIPERFGFRRTCAYFPRYSTSPFAYGFIRNCYLSGMTSVEALFAAMHGRFDLINKALSTATTGHSNRKLVMSFQSDIVNNYRSLAKDDTRILQFLTGDDAADTRSVQPVTLRTVFLDDAALAARFRLDVAAFAKGGGEGGAGAGAAGAAEAQATFDRAFARVAADRDQYRAAQLVFEDTGFDDPVTATRFVPVDVGHLVRNVEAARGAAGAGAPAARPPTVAALVAMQARVDGFCATLAYVYTNEALKAADAASGETSPPDLLFVATTLLQMFVRSELAGPVLARLTPGELEFVLDSTRRKIQEALIAPGTTAGILAAQAISEPLTQYMLDSHHRSVAGGTSKSGIERPTEIFRAKGVADEKTAEMFLRLRPEFEGDRARATQVANQIELMTLGHFLTAWAVIYERLGDVVHPAFLADRAWIAEYARHHPLQTPPGDLTRWCMRFVLDKSTMVLKGMSLERVVEHLRLRHPAVHVVHTPENSPQIVIRLYLRAPWFTRGRLPEDKIVEAVEAVFVPTVIRGVPGIVSASVVKTQRHFPTPGGGLEAREVFAVKTAGTNIAGILGNPFVDPARVVSSSIGDTLKMYGIVAAEMAIVRELARVMGASAPNNRHLTLCASEITLTGKLTPLELGGVKTREPQNVLLGAVFGDPTNRLAGAAITGAGARVYGAAPFLVVGAPPRIGSIYNEIIVDEDLVRAHLKSVEHYIDAL